MDYFRRPRQQPQRVGDRNLRVSLPDGTSALICTTPKMVAIHHLPTPGADPDWSVQMLLNDDDELREVFHPQLGWDIVKLVGLLWRQVEMRGLKIDLRRPEDRQQAGLRVETVSAQSQHAETFKSPRRGVGDTREAILAALESGRAMNRLDIARAIGRAKSPHLILIIERLVADGLIERVQSVRANGFVEFFYFRQ